MQSTIAQVIALTIHGNAFLRGLLPNGMAGFYPSNSTFTFCEYVKFVTLKTEGTQRQELAYAADPTTWMTRLKAEGVIALRVRYVPGAEQKLGDKPMPAYQLVALVGGGGRWLIEASKNSGVDYWEARWQVGDKEQKDRRIWRVSYGCIASNKKAPTLETANLDELKTRLGEQLDNIAAFARAQRLNNFAQAFERGLVCLTSSTSSEKLYHDDLAPAGVLPQAAAQLLNAVQAAWVFGAMGSWNDQGFEGEDQKTYEQLSADLYSWFIQAIVSATNTAASTPSKNRRWWQW